MIGAGPAASLDPMALTERDKAILDFERTWWTEAGPKDTAIRERFELSGTRYYQLLTELLDDRRRARLRPAPHPAPAPRARAPSPRPRRGAPDEPARRAIGETRTDGPTPTCRTDRQPRSRRRPRGGGRGDRAASSCAKGLDTSEAITTNRATGLRLVRPERRRTPTPPTGHRRPPPPRSPARPPGEVPTIVLNDSGDRRAPRAPTATCSRRSATSSPTPTAPTPTPKATRRDDRHLLRARLRGRGGRGRHRHRRARHLVPTPLPTTPPGPIAGASVVVVIGTDLGQRHAHHAAGAPPPRSCPSSRRRWTRWTPSSARPASTGAVPRLRRHAVADRAGGGRRPTRCRARCEVLRRRWPSASPVGGGRVRPARRRYLAEPTCPDVDRAARALRARGGGSTARPIARADARALAPGRGRGGRRGGGATVRPGVDVEHKGLSLTLHFRRAPELADAAVGLGARRRGAIGARRCGRPRCRSSCTRPSPSTRARWSRLAPPACGGRLHRRRRGRPAGLRRARPAGRPRASRP